MANKKLNMCFHAQKMSLKTARHDLKTHDKTSDQGSKI